ncbi:MAG TPA: GatB/YqeY domain-containing protein [Gemmatimonadaceae bacterium]|nr:GatB/YqeY domain-containing protein [Gemmatimonadaceae bacterium]
MRDRLREELQASRKARKTALTLVLGTVLADIENHQIALGRDITDDDVREVIRKAIKRRKESVAAFEKGGREELAARERAEADALALYLPAGVADDEIRAAVRAAIGGGAANLGAVMGSVVPQFKGRAEGSVINRIAREELGASA